MLFNLNYAFTMVWKFKIIYFTLKFIHYNCPSCYHRRKPLEELKYHIKKHFVDVDGHEASLFTNEHNSRMQDAHNTPNQLPNPLFANIFRSKTPRINKNIVFKETISSDNEEKAAVSARSPNALPLDLTSPILKHFSVDDAKERFVQQHRSTYACIVQSDGPRKYLESSLPEDAKVTHVELTNLPLLPETEMLKGHQLSLRPFGLLQKKKY
ncbi:unnamed protein product [Cunninghamella blakesleeana]